MNDTEVCNYADDMTIFACNFDENKVQYKLDADATAFPSGLLINI